MLSTQVFWILTAMGEVDRAMHLNDAFSILIIDSYRDSSNLNDAQEKGTLCPMPLFLFILVVEVLSRV
ncbi:hypothetical protein CMV_002616 [Castanea mollissima]|uniref:Uncharacterized protein n=1 Tax=Castanea mollissima TaxID=60419 RepID=A0A8J4S1K0_9ROSI|nr:hypothetical protein CMV_002616 [Castanea mollissima]